MSTLVWFPRTNRNGGRPRLKLSSQAIYNGAHTTFFRGIGNVITIKSDAIEFLTKCSRKRKYRLVLSLTANRSLSLIRATRETETNKQIINCFEHIFWNIVWVYYAPSLESSESSFFTNGLISSLKYLCVESSAFLVISDISSRSE